MLNDIYHTALALTSLPDTHPLRSAHTLHPSDYFILTAAKRHTANFDLITATPQAPNGSFNIYIHTCPTGATVHAQAFASILVLLAQHGYYIPDIDTTYANGDLTEIPFAAH